MADQPLYQQQLQQQGLKGVQPQKGTSTTQILAVVTLVPLGGILLCLAGITFVGTVIGLAVATPLFVLCSPILVPAALVIGLAVTGFLASGAFGVTAISSLSWIANYIQQKRGSVADQMEYAKKLAQETAAQVGQKARDVGQTVQGKAQEVTNDEQEAGKA